MSIPVFYRAVGQRLIVVGLPILLVLLSAFLVYREVVASIEDKIAAEVAETARAESQEIFKGLATYGQVVESIASFYDASKSVERDEFQVFTSHALEKFPAIRALEWVPRVPRAERKQMEQLARAEGFAGWSIRKYQPGAAGGWIKTEEDWAEEYFPVYYVEPPAGNEGAFGIDLNSHPDRRAALEKARDSGAAQATSGIKLAQAKGASVGLLYVVPIYTTKNIPPPQHRRDTLQGFALGVFHMGNILEPFLERRGGKTFDLVITDVTEPDQPKQLFSDHESGDSELSGDKLLTEPALVVTDTFGARTWQYEFFPTASFLTEVQQQQKGRPWLYLVGWLLLGATLGILLNSMLNRSQKVQQLVDQRTLELEQAEARFKTLFDSNGSGLLVTDKHGIIQLVNPSIETIFGYASGELIGQKVEMLVPQQYRETHVHHRTEYAKKPVHRPMSQSPRLLGRHKDGREVPVEIDLVPVDVAGHAMVLANVTDVTEKREAEAALTRAFEDLRRSNVELEQFAYVASHDLQEPLRAINSFSELLGMRYQGQLDGEADEFLSFITDGAKRAQALIRDLLAYSRVGTHGKPFAVTDCNHVLDGALNNLQLAIRDNQAQIERDPLPTIMGDEVQLTQLFQNLVGNAMKFCRPGDPPRIQVRARQLDARRWEISVQDNGIGIEPQYFERIFVIFQRLHPHEAYAGTGIGLAICKKIVDRHGGTIRVESEPGHGSTFSFTVAVDGTGPAAGATTANEPAS